MQQVILGWLTDLYQPELNEVVRVRVVVLGVAQRVGIWRSPLQPVWKPALRSVTELR